MRLSKITISSFEYPKNPLIKVLMSDNKIMSSPNPFTLSLNTYWSLCQRVLVYTVCMNYETEMLYIFWVQPDH